MMQSKKYAYAPPTVECLLLEQNYSLLEAFSLEAEFVNLDNLDEAPEQ